MNIDPNPYDILEIDRNADNATINQAFAQVMKQRKYPPDVIAKARKSLLNPKERIIADYLHPIMPSDICDFQREEFPDLESSPTPLEFLSEFDGLQAAISNSEGISEIDRRVGSTLTNFKFILAP